MQGKEYRVLARPKDGRQHILYSGPSITEAQRIYENISHKDPYTDAIIQSRPSEPWRTLQQKTIERKA